MKTTPIIDEKCLWLFCQYCHFVAIYFFRFGLSTKDTRYYWKYQWTKENQKCYFSWTECLIEGPVEGIFLARVPYNQLGRVQDPLLQIIVPGYPKSCYQSFKGSTKSVRIPDMEKNPFLSASQFSGLKNVRKFTYLQSIQECTKLQFPNTLDFF